MNRVALKTGGFFFLLSGWSIVLAAVALLPGAAARGGFMAAGMALEIAGLGLVLRAHTGRRARK